MRNVCFTLNNYTEDEYARILGGISWSYIIIGKEVGEAGTPHLQGYGELHKLTRFNTVRKYLCDRSHIESRRGTQEQAIVYCKKDGVFEERGIRRDQGYRADLDMVRGDALEVGMRGVTAKYNYQGIQVATKFLTYNEPVRDWKPNVTWLWGPTGSGKSRRAREMVGEDVYTKNSDSKWWDGYDGHEDIIIDDFRDSWWSLTYMLALLDRYAMQVEVKGGMRQIRARNIIVTCCKPPRECYINTGEAIEQLLRRIDVIELVVTDVTEVGVGNTSTTPTLDYEALGNAFLELGFDL
jgi:Putative viral replication protein/RNA helicase